MQGAPGRPSVTPPPQAGNGGPAFAPPPAITRQSAPPPSTPDQLRARRLDEFRNARRETREGDRVIIHEPGRTIIREGNRTIIRHNEADRFRLISRDVQVQRRGSETYTTVIRPGGVRIIDITDDSGRLVRRIRRDASGREYVIIDNRRRGPGLGLGVAFVALPAIAALTIPREHYIVETETAPPELIYGALMAPPVEPITRAYTLDEIRYSPSLRDRMPRVDIDTITFDTGSWEVTPDQAARLSVIAEGIKRAIAANPQEVFLIEGHTDAVGNDIDNLSLSDRRAEAVAVVLTEQFQIPPENLTTQGYGEQYLKIPTDGPERRNRRVTIRRITPLLQGAGGPGDPGAPPPPQ